MSGVVKVFNVLFSPRTVNSETNVMPIKWFLGICLPRPSGSTPDTSCCQMHLSTNRRSRFRLLTGSRYAVPVALESEVTLIQTRVRKGPTTDGKLVIHRQLCPRTVQTKAACSLVQHPPANYGSVSVLAGSVHTYGGATLSWIMDITVRYGR